MYQYLAKYFEKTVAYLKNKTSQIPYSNYASFKTLIQLKKRLFNRHKCEVSAVVTPENIKTLSDI